MKKKKPLPPPSPQCPLAPCVRLLAGNWTVEIIYYLQKGSLRFGELRRALNGVSAKVLTQRLRELESRSVIWRAVTPSTPPTVSYGLTTIGYELIPILQAMITVGEKINRRQALRDASINTIEAVEAAAN